MNRILTIFFFFALSIVSPDANAQCCSAGNPFFYGELSTMNKKNLQVVSGYKYSTSNKYFSEDHPVDIEFVDKAYFNYFTLQFIYGLTERATIQADLGYFLNKSETYTNNDWKTSNGYGLGDATLIFKYLAYQNWKKHFKVIPAFGVTLPIGVFDQESDHVKLPITVQPSSGSYKYQLSLYLSKGTDKRKINYSFFGMYEYAQLIHSKNFYYKYGNQFLLSVLTSYNISSVFSIALEARGENKARSLRNDDQTVESSGYKIVYLIPHISWAFLPDWYLAVNSDFPVYKYYNGIQLSNAFSASIRLSYNIRFGKKELSKLFEEEKN